jgi:hypothetical protein
MLELTKMDQINLNKMKEWVEKELDGLTVDLNSFLGRLRAVFFYAGV